MTNTNLKFKYVPSGAGIITFYAYLLTNVALLSAKRISALEALMGEVFMHTSNFIITSILLVTIGFLWMLQGAPFKFVIWLTVLAIILNFVVELWIRVLNTPDIVDAIYGSVGALISAVVVFAIKKTGLEKANNAVA